MPASRTRPTLAVAPMQSPSRDVTLQKFIELLTKKDDLQYRLALTMSSAATSPSSSISPMETFGLSPSKSFSPSGHSSNYQQQHTAASNYMSASSQPTQAMPFPSVSLPTYEQPGDEEQRLADVNRQIKATLTELLNHESVRNDDKFRHWVQERLMEAELETKRQRRRSRRRSSIDLEAVNAIAENIRTPPALFRFSASL